MGLGACAVVLGLCTTSLGPVLLDSGSVPLPSAPCHQVRAPHCLSGSLGAGLGPCNASAKPYDEGSGPTPPPASPHVPGSGSGHLCMLIKCAVWIVELLICLEIWQQEGGNCCHCSPAA